MCVKILGLALKLFKLCCKIKLISTGGAAASCVLSATTHQYFCGIYAFHSGDPFVQKAGDCNEKSQAFDLKAKVTLTLAKPQFTVPILHFLYLCIVV
jgi:hypothetical protein